MTCKNKNLQFEIQCGLRASSTRLYHYILERVDKFKPTEILFDLKEFNRYIFKNRGRPYDRKTVKEAIAQLDEKTFGRFTIVKTFHWHLLKIRVLPLKMAIAKKREIEQQEKSQSGDLAPKPKRGNPMFSEEHKERLALQQQQDISKLDAMLSKLGLKYTDDNLLRLWRMAGKSWEDINRAIEYMLYSNSSQTEGVRKPRAFLMECLKCGWHKGFDLMYEGQVKLPYFQFGSEIAKFVSNLSPPNKMCQT